MQYVKHKRCECGHTRATHNYTNPNPGTNNLGGYSRCRGYDWTCVCKEYKPPSKKAKEPEHDGYSNRQSGRA